MLGRATHRIRRCKGNKATWCLIALNDQGEENSYGASTTALSIDDLLRHSKGLLPGEGDLIELVYYSEDDS